MQFAIILLAIEHPAELTTKMPGDFLHRRIGHQETIQLWSQILDRRTKHQATLSAIVISEEFIAHYIDITLQNFQLIVGMKRKAVSDNTGLKIVIEQRRNQSVFITASHNDIVYKRIVLATHLQQTVT